MRRVDDAWARSGDRRHSRSAMFHSGTHGFWAAVTWVTAGGAGKRYLIGMTSNDQTRSPWRHPTGARAWWLEVGLGCAVALVAFQALSGLTLALAADDQLGSRIGPIHLPILLTWHLRAGIAALLAIPLLAMGHPAPRPGADGKGRPGRPCVSPVVRGLGLLTALSLTVMFFTGPAIVVSRWAGVHVPHEIVHWHALAGKAASILVLVHLALAMRSRHRRWSVRRADKEPPRFRGHWLEAAAVLLGILMVRLAQMIGLLASP